MDSSRNRCSLLLLFGTVHFLQPRAFTPSLSSRSNRCSLILALCLCHNGNSFPHSLSQHMSHWETLCPEVASITACNGAMMGDATWGNWIRWEGRGQLRPCNRMPALQLIKHDLSIICRRFVIYSWDARTLTYQEILTSLGRLLFKKLP